MLLDMSLGELNDQRLHLQVERLEDGVLEERGMPENML